MKEQEPKSRAQFLEERVANSCLNYQSKHGFDTAFDLILEDVIELRKMVYSVSGETPKPDLPEDRFANIPPPLTMGQMQQVEEARIEMREDFKEWLDSIEETVIDFMVSQGWEFDEEMRAYKDNAVVNFMPLSEKLSSYIENFEKVSGEAKTPDACECPACKEATPEMNALADAYLTKVGFVDKMHTIRHDYINGLTDAKELTGGSVPTPDPPILRKMFGLITNIKNVSGEEYKCWRDEVIEEFREHLNGSVPTPNDEQIESEAMEQSPKEYMFDQNAAYSKGVHEYFIEGFKLGAKWLRGRLSPEQEKQEFRAKFTDHCAIKPKVGKDADKG